MLQIHLNKPSGITEDLMYGVANSATAACPDHLVLADLPVAKGFGLSSAIAVTKIIGRRSHRLTGERVHFCVHCDFPIAIYGRLNPCEHAFCLDCARSSSYCFICDERVHKIQTVKTMEGVFICSAPRCLKSFLGKTQFESHIKKMHCDLLPEQKKQGTDSEATNSIFQPPFSFAQDPRPVPHFTKQAHYPDVQQSVSDDSRGFCKAMADSFPEQSFNPQVSLLQNSVLVDQSSLVDGYAPDGIPLLFQSQHEIVRPDQTHQHEPENGSFLGFQAGPPGPKNHSWNQGLHTARASELPTISQESSDCRWLHERA